MRKDRVVQKVNTVIFAWQLFLPCASGVEELLAAEVKRITGTPGKAWRAGVQVAGSWRDAMQLNLRSRLSQRVLIELQHNPYRSEQDLYNAAAAVAWEIWFNLERLLGSAKPPLHLPTFGRFGG